MRFFAPAYQNFPIMRRRSREEYFASCHRTIQSQLFAAYGQYNAEVLKEQFDHIVRYRPAPAANRTASIYEESFGYTSGYAHSKTDHEHGKK